MNRLWMALFLVAATRSAPADEVQLANGRKLEGIVIRKTASEVVVEVGAGTITLAAKDVSSISPGRTALHELNERLESVKNSRKASDHYELALWAKQKQLSRPVLSLSLKAVELDPEHAGARALLRHEKRDGRWLTFEQAQEARGLQWTGDHWATAAEIQLVARQRLEAEARRLAAETAREQRREDERQRREQAQVAQEQRIAQVMSQMDGYFYSPSFAFTTPYFRPFWHAPYLRSRRHYQEGWMYGGGGYSWGLGGGWGPRPIP